MHQKQVKNRVTFFITFVNAVFFILGINTRFNGFEFFLFSPNVYYIYGEKYTTALHLWDRDKCFTFWVKMSTVKVMAE